MAPLGDGGTDPQFFQSHDLEYWWNAKNNIFCPKKFWGRGTPYPYPQNNNTQKFHIPTLPIHYDFLGSYGDV